MTNRGNDLKLLEKFRSDRWGFTIYSYCLEFTVLISNNKHITRKGDLS